MRNFWYGQKSWHLFLNLALSAGICGSLILNEARFLHDRNFYLKFLTLEFTEISTLFYYFTAMLISALVCYVIKPANAKVLLFIITLSFAIGALYVFAATFHNHGGLIDVLGGMTKDNKLKIDNDPETCLYFSIVTWTTLGYGDYAPSLSVRMIAAQEALFGYVTMVMLLGTAGVFPGAHTMDKKRPNHPRRVKGARRCCRSYPRRYPHRLRQRD